MKQPCKACRERLLDRFPRVVEPVLPVWEHYLGSGLSLHDWRTEENTKKVVLALQRVGTISNNAPTCFHGLVVVASLVGIVHLGSNLFTFCRDSVGHYESISFLKIITPEQGLVVQAIHTTGIDVGLMLMDCKHTESP